MAVRLEWEGKPKHVERLSLPFQTVETINVPGDTGARRRRTAVVAEKVARRWSACDLGRFAIH